MPTKKIPTSTRAKSTARPTKKVAVKPVAKSATKPELTKVTKARRAAAVTANPTLDLIKRYRSHKGDTGSTDIQIIGVTESIIQLTNHLATHTKDHDSRRGLLMMVGKRRRLLNYLKRQDEATYTKLVADLGLRK